MIDVNTCHACRLKILFRGRENNMYRLLSGGRCAAISMAYKPP
jgi:DNA-directed RNA polymerase subunit RPC12/RpoP